MYLEPFTASKRTRCARVQFCGMSHCSFTKRAFCFLFCCCCFLNIHGCGIPVRAIWLLHGRCRMTETTTAILAHVLCTLYNHALVHSTVIRSHIRRKRVCLAVACRVHFRQTRSCYFGNTGVERIPQ